MDYVELFLAKLLSNARGHEAARFTKGPAFTQFPSPTITVSSPSCGPSHSLMSLDYTQDGADLFPSLSWDPVPGAKEYILISEDVDAPLPRPVTHGTYHSIPASKTSVQNEDFDPVHGTRKNPGGGGTHLKGGFKYGANMRGTVYGGPRALKGHGPHRYYFMVVALGEELKHEGLSLVVKKEDIAREVEGKVLGWGEWVGVSERRWG